MNVGMMNLRTMGLITDVTDCGRLPKIAQVLCERWQGDSGTLRYLRSSSNHVFAFADNGEGRVLRLSHESERGRGQLEAEADLILHIAARGLPVAKPIPSRKGHLVEEGSTDGHLYYAMVFEAVRGRQFLELDDLSPEMYKAWGNTLARLHEATAAFEAHADRSRPTWEDQLQHARQWLPSEEKEARGELASGSEWAASLGRCSTAYGIIHGDLEPDNMTWDGRTFHVFDFDSSRYHWRLADIALAVQDFLTELNPKREETLEWFVEGYRAVRDIPEPGLESMPRFLRLERVFGMARHYYQFDGVKASMDKPLHRKCFRYLDRFRAELAQPFDW